MADNFEITLRNGRKITEENWLYREKHILPFLKNPDDAKRYSYGSGKKIFFKCPLCGFERNAVIQSVVENGFNCKKCSDTTSMPERLTLSILDSINVNYEYQKTLKGLPNRIFDFYLPTLNIAIELNGEQHYKKTSIYNYKRTIESDEDKKVYCEKNNINLYFINCYSVNINNIILQISNIKELETEDFDIKNIKKLLGTRCVNDTYKDVLKLYNKGFSTDKLAEKYSCSKTKINYILQRQGVTFRNSGKSYKKVRCINTQEVFATVRDATTYAGIKNNVNICAVCSGKQKTAGKHPITGEPLKWEYVM
ncbi:Uncharacterized phage protein [Staphylococcus xylosus]|uniref:zinc-ribbon domain-containing protein n=1 Tax=Staphylococcus xylosus TaxID=1288 RepID=UPI0004F5DB03|nr:zinc-ribbon domain-containing protein [Staphylococcus xylosus]CEF19112.1 Uncharacterized phage protein [Staphylococcus xylosus]